MSVWVVMMMMMMLVSFKAAHESRLFQKDYKQLLLAGVDVFFSGAPCVRLFYSSFLAVVVRPVFYCSGLVGQNADLMD